MRSESEIRGRLQEVLDRAPKGSATIYLDRYDGPRREAEALAWVLGMDIDWDSSTVSESEKEDS